MAVYQETVGLNLGASSVSAVTVRPGNGGVEVVTADIHAHEGNVRDTVQRMLGADRPRLAVTGRRYRDLLRVPQLTEPEAVEYALSQTPLAEGVDAVVSAGGETFILYLLDPQGRIGNVYTGSKCASGTGEFYLQQLERIGISPEEAYELAMDQEPLPLAGRCSVFCKSDCTHALNKGMAKGGVVAGLCHMMAQKIVELAEQAGARSLLVTGGCSQNRLMVDALSEHLVVQVPPHARCFEALGAALWGLEQQVPPLSVPVADLFAEGSSRFSFLPPLSQAVHRVTFEEMPRDRACPGDDLLVGLDVGSTTTKAVLIRRQDASLLGSIYLRTRGDPVGAARRCYEELVKFLPAGGKVQALGITGSGRRIAALHAQSPAVINEIVAHAAAARYFDPQVDTILEIGGQDAKFTHLVQGVPADYAMNEACAAGTGSFLEESAWETLEVPMADIADRALAALRVPNFNDQCSAFISSDIKSAIQEGLQVGEILAGLVYSVCLNYLTRVKGNRPVGSKVFLQGGVCYNRAVPVAMAALLDRPVTVPPEPGLMGAFGVALEVRRKLEQGHQEPSEFDLARLARREIRTLEPFTCQGSGACDRRCRVNRLEVSGRILPFGGACDRYYGMGKESRREAPDLTRRRAEEVLREPLERADVPTGPVVGINRSLLTHSLFPLYATFFRELGFAVRLAGSPQSHGYQRQAAPFCYPLELAHGHLAALLEERPDFFFLPQVRGLPPTAPGAEASVLCPLAQGEPYILKAAFPELERDGRLLSPVLDFSGGWEAGARGLVALASDLGVSRTAARKAFGRAQARQQEVQGRLLAEGRRFLEWLEENAERKAVIIFGRSYNAFTAEANLGIPRKFASRGWPAVPCDMLPFARESAQSNMYWASGQMIIQAARLVQRHPQLFGVYITHFSCGPDSFLVGYFRDIMGEKPSLTLELDGHTADAGLDTRVEAFLDIVRGYQETRAYRKPPPPRPSSARAVCRRNSVIVATAQGETLPLEHPRVKLLIPAIGADGNRLLAAAFIGRGVQAEALPAPGSREMTLGRSHSTCKECLPLQLTVGSLLARLEDRPPEPGEQWVYFMPETSGPCRFGQYRVFIDQLISRLGLDFISTLSLTSENSYGGLGTGFTLRGWMAVVLGDLLDEIRNTLLVVARDKEQARQVVEEAYEDIERALAGENLAGIRRALREVAGRLISIPRRLDPAGVPRVVLLGEIYVRADPFSRQGLVEYLARQEIITRVAPVHEWFYYCDYLLRRRLGAKSDPAQRRMSRVVAPFKIMVEREAKRILGATGLCSPSSLEVSELVEGVSHLIGPELTGEAVLTIGGAIREIVDEVDGAIAIGPFGCMPNRLAQAVTGPTLSREKSGLTHHRRLVKRVLEEQPHLPFMALETDGGIFPQVVEARLESFVLQVRRLHRLAMQIRNERPSAVS